jgi:NADH:ubiquinone oxidoreductase subunit D
MQDQMAKQELGDPSQSGVCCAFPRAAPYLVYDQFDPDALAGTGEDCYDCYCIYIEVM